MLYYSPLPHRCSCYERLCIRDYTFKIGTKIKTKLINNLNLAYWWVAELRSFSICFLLSWIIIFWIALFQLNFNYYLLGLSGLLFFLNLCSESRAQHCHNYAKNQNSDFEIMVEYNVKEQVDQAMNIILNNLKQNKNIVSIIDDYIGELEILREYNIDIFE